MKGLLLLTATVLCFLVTACEFNGGEPSQAASTEPRLLRKTNVPQQLRDSGIDVSGTIKEVNIAFGTLIAETTGKPPIEERDLQAIHEKVQRYIASNSDDSTETLIKQTAGLYMLDGVLLLPDDARSYSNERKELISYYTDMLIEQDNSDTRILRNALNALEGYWSEERISEAVDNIVADAELAAEASKNTGSELPHGFASKSIAMTEDASGLALEELKEMQKTEE